MSQQPFWFSGMRGASKASVADGALPVRGGARLMARYGKLHSIDESGSLSRASTSSEDGSAEVNVDAEERAKGKSVRWDLTGEEFTLVHCTRGRRKLYQRQQIPILKGEPQHSC